MVMRVQKIGDSYGVVFSPHALEALGVMEGAEIEVKRVEAPETTSEIHYVGVEEGMAIFKELEPFHRNTFRELAK